MGKIMQQTTVKIFEIAVITTTDTFILQPMPVPVFTYWITLNSHASNRLKNLYFHNNTYYCDANINDYMQLLE